MFFFNDTATTEIYTLSLHDALPISYYDSCVLDPTVRVEEPGPHGTDLRPLSVLEHRLQPPAGDNLRVVVEEKYVLSLGDRKSTRLNSSHANISYAVFCLKKTTCIRI